MKKTRGLLTIGLLSASIILLFSCKDNIIPAAKSYQGDVKLLSMVEKEVSQDLSAEISEELIVEEILDEVITDLESSDFLKSEHTCPAITIEQPEDARYPRVVTKDFGDGCINDRGILKSGKIIITINGQWLRKGSTRTVTFENYTHDSILVTGQKEIVCLGLNEDSLYVHKITGEIELSKPNGAVVQREIHKRRTILTGIEDRTVPMEWLIEGRTEVSRSNGIQYTMKIKEPLHKIKGCKWYQSGVKRMDIEKLKEEETIERKVIIDYSYAKSDKNCDRYALRVIDDGEPVVIKLR